MQSHSLLVQQACGLSGGSSSAHPGPASEAAWDGAGAPRAASLQPSAAAAALAGPTCFTPAASARFTAAAPIEAGAGWAALVAGPALQCFEAATLGMPLEVWKTYLGRNRGVGTVQALRDIYAGGGLPAFWAGTSAKMMESASKGVVLMWAKESLLTAFGDTFSPGKRKWRERETRQTRSFFHSLEMMRQTIKCYYSSLKLTALPAPPLFTGGRRVGQLI